MIAPGLEALRQKVKKGMRNATLMAIAPTANISHVAGTTPGLDLQFSQIFGAAYLSSKFLEVNANLVRKLKQQPVESLKDDLLANQIIKVSSKFRRQSATSQSRFQLTHTPLSGGGASAKMESTKRLAQYVSRVA